MVRLPLNGLKTHPMKGPTKDAFDSLKCGKEIFCQSLNPGSVDRLLREPGVELVHRLHNFKRGTKSVAYLRYIDPNWKASK